MRGPMRQVLHKLGQSASDHSVDLPDTYVRLCIALCLWGTVAQNPGVQGTTGDCNNHVICPANAKCVNSTHCTCLDGYQPDGNHFFFTDTTETCNDINECVGPSPPDCGANADCNNAPGSYSCTCIDGYEPSSGKANFTHPTDNSCQVKPLSETRWESQIDALKPLRYHLGDICDAQIEIYDETTLTGSSGNMARVDAKDLAKAISSFKFLVSLVMWYDILFEINMTGKQLQAKEFDISDAINQHGETKKFLVGHRSDADFEKTLVDAGELAEELDIPALVEPDPIRIRKKRKQFTYEADDEPIYNLKEKFKVNFYFAVINTAIHSVEERFTVMQQISSVFGFLYDVYRLQNTTPKQSMEHCLNLEQALQHGESKDTDAFDLCNELQAIAQRVQKSASPQAVLNFICTNKLTDSVPNTGNALHILLTLPASVASGERSFSKLKSIKTHMRTSELQQTLVGLLTSIEQGRSTDLEELVSKFAKLKTPKN
ncbi:uncharacterized protein LOC123353812 [Mauremys mutica]|uniref:uncharacterized protein LOC123353812 n=1 Tax=Mauremys mutica TaxID=74926 RepID=UPI001D169BCA|nr:uncharacterized protein LOC123353812 [Mauremys mutica]